jgi:DNA-directed RNA polymerase subunit K/omega
MSKKDIKSRVLEIDTEKCVRNSGGSRYDMILMASARAREIRQQHRSSQDHQYQHTVVTALLEVQNKELDQKIILKIK